MSAPSTATRLHANPHQLGYAHQPSYPSNGATYQHNPSTSTTRLANSYHTFPNENMPATKRPPDSPPPKQSSRVPTSHSNPSLPSLSSTARGRRGHPDWQDFYKNGLPKEVIVIDDTPPPTEDPQRTENGRGLGGYVPGPSAIKKRKVGLDNNQSYHDRPSHSVPSQKYGDGSSGTPASTDRTTSQHTTAPTSLGPYGSSGASNSYEDVNTGQKRKRNTRNATKEELKRKEAAAAAGAFEDYVPPPRPPIKAAEVHVPVKHVSQHIRNQKCDDEDGHFVVNQDTEITDRYLIIKLLGQGTFGKVVEAYDKVKKTRCAVKIIRSVQKYRDASRIELRVLSTLASNDRPNRNKCIHLRDCFDYRNHICIVTDLLGQSVFDFLKGNGFVPFPSSQIQNFARQLLTSVAFLHDLNLIHTDLKPENILLVHNQYQTFTYGRTIPCSSQTSNPRVARQRKVLLDSEIRLIDFGSATFNDEYHSTVVSTRHYRAPEIILNLGWSFPCDIWSIGCILVEFFTGDALFQTHDNLEHLAMMEPICGGKIDKELIDKVMRGGRGNSGNQAAKFFKRKALDYPNNDTTRASRKYVKAMKHLEEVIPAVSTFNKEFLNLLKRIFVYDPVKRITAHEALKHPWFKESLIDDGVEALRIKDEREQEARDLERERARRNKRPRQE